MLDNLILGLLLNKLLIHTVTEMQNAYLLPPQYNHRRECRLYLKTKINMTIKMNVDEGESTSVPHHTEPGVSG